MSSVTQVPLCVFSVASNSQRLLNTPTKDAATCFVSSPENIIKKNWLETLLSEEYAKSIVEIRTGHNGRGIPTDHVQDYGSVVLTPNSLNKLLVMYHMAGNGLSRRKDSAIYDTTKVLRIPSEDLIMRCYIRKLINYGIYAQSGAWTHMQRDRVSTDDAIGFPGTIFASKGEIRRVLHSGKGYLEAWNRIEEHILSGTIFKRISEYSVSSERLLAIKNHFDEIGKKDIANRKFWLSIFDPVQKLFLSIPSYVLKMIYGTFFTQTNSEFGRTFRSQIEHNIDTNRHSVLSKFVNMIEADSSELVATHWKSTSEKALSNLKQHSMKELVRLLNTLYKFQISESSRLYRSHDELVEEWFPGIGRIPHGLNAKIMYPRLFDLEHETTESLDSLENVLNAFVPQAMTSREGVLGRDPFFPIAEGSGRDRVDTLRDMLRLLMPGNEHMWKGSERHLPTMQHKHILFIPTPSDERIQLTKLPKTILNTTVSSIVSIFLGTTAVLFHDYVKLSQLSKSIVKAIQPGVLWLFKKVPTGTWGLGTLLPSIQRHTVSKWMTLIGLDLALISAMHKFVTIPQTVGVVIPPFIVEEMVYNVFIPMFEMLFVSKLNQNLAFTLAGPTLLIFYKLITEIIPNLVMIIAKTIGKRGEHLYDFVMELGSTLGSMLVGMLVGLAGVSIPFMGPLTAGFSALAVGAGSLAYYEIFKYRFFINALTDFGKSVGWLFLKNLKGVSNRLWWSGNTSPQDSDWEWDIFKFHAEEEQAEAEKEEKMKHAKLIEEDDEFTFTTYIGARGDETNVRENDVDSVRERIATAIDKVLRISIGGQFGKLLADMFSPFAQSPSMTTMLGLLRGLVSREFLGSFTETLGVFTTESTLAAHDALRTKNGKGTPSLGTIARSWLVRMHDYFSSEPNDHAPVLDTEDLSIVIGAPIGATARDPSGVRVGPFSVFLNDANRLYPNHDYWKSENVRATPIIRELLKIGTLKGSEEEEEGGEGGETPFYDIEGYLVTNADVLGNGVIIQWLDREHKRLPVDFYPKLNYKRHLSFLESAGTLSHYGIAKARECEASLVEDIEKMVPTGSMSSRPLLSVIRAVASLVGGSTTRRQRLKTDVVRHLQWHDEKEYRIMYENYTSALNTLKKPNFALATVLLEAGKNIAKAWSELYLDPSTLSIQQFSALFLTQLSGSYHIVIGEDNGGIYRERDRPEGVEVVALTTFSTNKRRPDLLISYQHALFMHYLAKNAREANLDVDSQKFREWIINADLLAVNHLMNLITKCEGGESMDAPNHIFETIPPKPIATLARTSNVLIAPRYNFKYSNIIRSTHYEFLTAYLTSFQTITKWSNKDLIFHQLLATWYVTNPDAFERCSTNTQEPLVDIVNNIHENEVVISRALDDLKKRMNTSADVASNLIVSQIGPSHTIHIFTQMKQRSNHYLRNLPISNLIMNRKPNDDDREGTIIWIKQLAAMQRAVTKIEFAFRITDPAIFTNLDEALRGRLYANESTIARGSMDNTIKLLTVKDGSVFHDKFRPKSRQRGICRVSEKIWDTTGVRISNVESLSMLLSYVSRSLRKMHTIVKDRRHQLINIATESMMTLVNAVSSDLHDLFKDLSSYADLKISEAKMVTFDKSLEKDLDTMREQNLMPQRMDETSTEFLRLVTDAKFHYYVFPLLWEFEETIETKESHNRTKMILTRKLRNETLLGDEQDDASMHLASRRNVVSHIELKTEESETIRARNIWVQAAIRTHRMNAVMVARSLNVLKSV